VARTGPTAYGEAFADVYDDWYAQVSDVDATVAAVAHRAAGGPVLELGVGSGRLALPLAAAGVEVWGLDASWSMLARLARKPGGRRVRAVLGDMAAPPLRADGRFAVVFCAFNTFFNLATEAEQAACLAWSAAAVAPGGVVAVEAFVPAGAEAPDDETVTVRSAGPDRVVLNVSRRDPRAQVITGRFVDLAPDGVHLRPYRVRYLFPDQLDALAAAAGLVRERRDEDWSGRPFDEDSPTHVSCYRRAAP